MSFNYVYMLKEREFLNSGEQVYKIGRSTQPNDKRFSQHPKGSVLLFQTICSNCCNVEKDIKKKFKTEFKQRLDIGEEYFEGNFNKMLYLLLDIVKGDCDNIQYLIPKSTSNDKNIPLNKEVIRKIEDYLESKYTFISLGEYELLPKLEKNKNIINRSDIYAEFISDNIISLSKNKFYSILKSKYVSHRTTKIKSGILGRKK